MIFLVLFIVACIVGILILTGVINLGSTTTSIVSSVSPIPPTLQNTEPPILQNTEPPIPENTISTTIPTLVAPPSITIPKDENVKIDASCLSNANPPVLEDSYYTMTRPILGKELKQMSKIEPFALTGTVVIDPRQLDPNTSYLIGTLQRSNTISEARNGGTPCPAEFPTTIYRRL